MSTNQVQPVEIQMETLPNDQNEPNEPKTTSDKENGDTLQVPKNGKDPSKPRKIHMPKVNIPKIKVPKIDINGISNVFNSYATKKTITTGFFNIALVRLIYFKKFLCNV